MNARRRIIGLGQPFAGDDAVGLAVIAHLRAQRLTGIELREAVDATELIGLVGDGTPLVLVDAIVGVPAGLVRKIAIEELDHSSPLRASSHGFEVRQIFALAQALSIGADMRPCAQLVGIGIASGTRGESRLSAAVRSAVCPAAALALALVRSVRCPGEGPR
jgi:hydrogenase maturation protease